MSTGIQIFIEFIFQIFMPKINKEPLCRLAKFVQSKRNILLNNIAVRGVFKPYF